MLVNDIAQDSTVGSSSFVDVVEGNTNPGVLLDEEIDVREDNLPNIEDRKLAFFYTNADSLGNKVNELHAIAMTYEFDIICITETLPKFRYSSQCNLDINLDKYDSYCTDSGRGIAIYIRQDLKSELVKANTNFHENLLIKIKLNEGKELLLGCIYRSPNSSLDNNRMLVSLIEEMCSMNMGNLVVGDFNLKEVDWPNHYVNASEQHFATILYDRLNDLFLEQLIMEPTRHRAGERPNILDWIVTDSANLVENIKIGAPLGVRGDHNTITFEFEIPPEYTKLPERLNLYRGDYESMINILLGINWQEKLENLNCEQSWECFHGLMMNLIDNHIPLFRKSNNKKKLWMDNETREVVREKNRSWNRYRRNKSEANWKEFTVVRNRTNHFINKKKSKFELRIAEEIQINPKQFWRYVKSKSPSNREFPTMIDLEGKIHDSDQSKCEMFNSYFANVYTLENLSNIPSTTTTVPTVLMSCDITLEKVKSLLTKLNTSKAAGPDNLHSKILFELREVISTPLFMIFNKSLSEGVLPQMWKQAIIKPLFKKGSKKVPSNYRPVSLTSVCCNLLEKLVRNTIVEYHSGLYGIKRPLLKKAT